MFVFIEHFLCARIGLGKGFIMMSKVTNVKCKNCKMNFVLYTIVNIVFLKTSITEYKTERLQQWKFILSQFWNWKPEIKGLAGLFSSEVILLGLQMTVVSLYLYMEIPLHICVLIYSSYKDISHIWLGFSLIIHNLIPSFRTLSLNPTVIFRYEGLGLQHINFEE